MRCFNKVVFGVALAAGFGSCSMMASAAPVTGCVTSATVPVVETCTLVEAAESGEPGSSETVSATSVFSFNSGYVPIFESASGAATSAFPLSTNPPGVVGAVGDYVFITKTGASTPSTFTLVSDGFPSALLTSLLAGMTRITPLGSDGITPIVVAEPDEGILNQPVDFFLTILGVPRLEHVVAFSDVSVPEPASISLFGISLLATVLLWRTANKWLSSPG
jgi:hypothetical protein